MPNIWVPRSPESPVGIADERGLSAEVCAERLGLESVYREGIEILAEHANRGTCAYTDIGPDDKARVTIDSGIYLYMAISAH
jgi:hypothetical protein